MTAERSEAGRPVLGRIIAVGLAGGFLSGMFGVGGGIVMVPLIMWLLHHDRHAAHATSLAAIFIIALSGVVAYGRASSLAVPIGLALGVGGVVGGVAGASLMDRMSPRMLQAVFAAILIGAGLRMVLA